MEPTFLGLEDGLGALDGEPFFVGMLLVGDRKNKLMRGTKRINYLPKLQACTTTNVKAAGTDRNLLLFQLYTDLDSNFFIGYLYVIGTSYRCWNLQSWRAGLPLNHKILVFIIYYDSSS